MFPEFIEDSKQPTAAGRSGRFSELYPIWVMRTQHVSINIACTRTVCNWCGRNNGHL